LKVAITIDLHTSDYPYEIEYCLEYLAKENLPATFFIPTRMLENRLYREAFLKLKTSSHELATHSHHHNDKEINALKNGGIKDLAFLSLSKGIFENFFQCSPHTFRSPSWCSLSRMTLEYLHKLGYSV
jgi:peptidoglycan/xylan/chitin deacetylase (PgdA/CDA1 family)